MVHAFSAAVAVPPAAIAVVGDTPHDLEMAHAAGAGLAIGVLTGASPRESLAPRAHQDSVLGAGCYSSSEQRRLAATFSGRLLHCREGAAHGD